MASFFVIIIKQEIALTRARQIIISERKNKMKRNTLIKVICLVLVSLFVVSLAACTGGSDDTEKVTIYLDPNGGTLPEGTADEFEVAIGESLGKLPTPTRGGYEFLGWYEDGNERWEVDRRTKAEYEMEIVALWQPMGDLVTVEFTVGPDETLDTSFSFIEVVKGQRISTAISKLPSPTRPDYKFKYWQDANKNTVSLTTQVNGDLVLTPVWEQIIYCFDGTENHSWSPLQDESEATCTTDATRSRTCQICGHKEYITSAPATGHRYDDFVLTVSESGALVRSRTCQECDEPDTEPLKNIAYTDFNTPKVDGPIMTGGIYGPTNLVDGDYYGSFCGNGTGAVKAIFDSKDPDGVYVDVICVAGAGSSTYTVSITYADGSTQDLGIGAFGGSRENPAVKPFDVYDTIVSIEIKMANPSNGMDWWSEVAICVINN